MVKIKSENIPAIKCKMSRHILLGSVPPATLGLEQAVVSSVLFSRTETRQLWKIPRGVTVYMSACVFAEMQREHQRREHRLQEAHCCALSTMEEARQHQIRVGFTQCY